MTRTDRMPRVKHTLIEGTRAWRDFRNIARHVVKFADGSYLPYNLKYESRVLQQRYAHRWLTWASAKMIAESDALKGTGARAVHLKPKST